MEQAPSLTGWLEPALGLIEEPWLPAVQGPRSWWAGPLDVEGLALASVEAALTAYQGLTGERGWSTSSAQVAASFGSFEHLRVNGRAVPAFAPMSGFFAAADGWVRLHANYPHHAAVLRDRYAVTSPEDLARVLHGIPALEVEDQVREACGVAAAVRSPQDWRATPTGEALAAEPWIRWTLDGRPGAAPAGPGLAGVRVLDLTRVIAGPTGTRLLALLGADVLRIDPPHRPEILAQHLDTGAGKRSAVADLRDAVVGSRVEDLLEAVDVVVTGYRPGSLDRFGLSPAGLRERHPHLVVVTLDAWGEAGPWAEERGFDSIVQAGTGIAHTYGAERDGVWRPGALPVQALDHATGYGVAAAVTALLHRRSREGAGSAHLSLARTAHLLLDLPRMPGAQVDLPVARHTCPSPHGVLTQAGAPVSRDGIPQVFTAPGRYGAAELTW